MTIITESDLKKGCDLMIDLDENYKLIDTLDKRLEQLGDSL